MGVATAVAVVGAVTAVVGAGTSANSAAHAATAQHTAAAEWASRNQAQVAQAQAAYEQFAPAQQAGIERAISNQERNIQRQETLVQSIDPALLDAGKQMQSLLDGQSAPVLKNIQDQRLRQRNDMLDNLRQQIGPGAETSSMGQNMMMKFDAETANILNGAQQQYLDKVSGLALGGAQTLGDTLTRANAQLSSLSNQLGDIGLNEANIKLGGINATSQANQALYGSAGAANVGQQILGQGLTQLGGAAIQGAAAYAGSGGGGDTLGANVTPGDTGMTVGTNSGISETGVMPKATPSALGTYGGGNAGPSAPMGNGPYSSGYIGSGYNPQPNYASGYLGNSVQRPMTAGGY